MNLREPAVYIIPKKKTDNYRKVAGYPDYEINRKGVVRNRKTRRVLTVNHAGSGSVTLLREGKRREILIYNLLEATFGRGQF